jgi:hypothetical protein
MSRRLLAVVLSLILVLVGIVVIGVGVICAIVAVEEAVKQGDVPTWIVAACFGLIVGGGLVFGGVRFITRVRPWMVRRLTGREVPRVPAPLRALATGPGGEWASGGD